MPSKMFNVKAKPLSVDELKCKCKWIADNWNHFIIVTESLQNRKIIKDLIKGVVQCHNTLDADLSLSCTQSKNIVVTYNTFTHIAYKCRYLGTNRYQVIFLDSDEIQYPKSINCDDFQMAIERLYICVDKSEVKWINDKYSGRWTGVRILCDNHLLQTDGRKVFAIESKSLDYNIEEVRKFYITS